MVSRVTFEVGVASSKSARDSFLEFDRPTVLERELAKFDASRRA